MVKVLQVVSHPRFVYTFGERLVRSRRSRRWREGVDTFGPVQHVYTVYTINTYHSVPGRLFRRACLYTSFGSHALKRDPQALTMLPPHRDPALIMPVAQSLATLHWTDVLADIELNAGGVLVANIKQRI